MFKVWLSFLLFLSSTTYAGMDFSMLGEVPDFPDRTDAIFFGLINNENGSVIKEIREKIDRLQRDKLNSSYRILKTETDDEYDLRIQYVKHVMIQVDYLQQALIVATDMDYAMIDVQSRIKKYENLHHIKFNHVGSDVTISSEVYHGQR